MNRQSSPLDNTQKLSDVKRALLEKRLRGDSLDTKEGGVIPAAAASTSIPLSFGQERLWFLHQLDPRSPAYNMYNVVQIQGPLDTAILAESFNLLIRRHQILRTHFPMEGDRPVQKVSPENAIAVSELDLQFASELDREISVQEIIKTEIRHPFDLARGPLLRALLIRLAGDDHILVLTIHHIIFDEWSNNVFWQDFSQIYQALVSNSTPLLSDLPVQYTDFTLWQKRQVERQTGNQLAFWKRQLAGDLPLLQMPMDHPRPPQQSYRGALVWQHVPNPLYAKLKAVNQELGTTVFMILLAAFQLLLGRYTGQDDILVGTPIANRSRPETMGLIGLFLNTIVLRANLEGDISFNEFASRTREATLDAFMNQDLPFEILVDELHPHRDKSHNPIFQVMFVHQKSAFDKINLPGLKVSQLTVDPGVAKFDLTLFAQESDDNLSIGLEYNSDLFDQETPDRFLQHFQTLLESIVRDPGQPISSLQFFGAEERHTILYEWNETATEPLPEICIHQRIERQGDCKPDAIAVATQGSELNYRDLNLRANQIAHTLRRQGVGPNVPVGLLLDRSTEMIVTILAVMKAGGAYLPLDPDYPSERLVFMLEDSQAPVVITHSKFSNKIHAQGTKTLFVDGLNESADEGTGNLVVPSRPDDLAYIIYTSGSTGKPRGVPVTHRNLIHSTLARDYYYEDRSECFLLLSSFTFDSSIAGIFWTLCQGGKLVLPPQRIEQDINQLSEIVESHAVTHTLCLPSLYTLLLDLADPARLSTLKTVIVAGEACPLSLVRQHYDLLPNADLYNEYGPTEGTVWSTAYKIPPTLDRGRVPIGRPIPNTQNYILDRHDHPTPIGIPGELCIAGDGVTLGYLNDPEKTAQKFVQISLDENSSRRIYRTGDRARYLPDGNIDFLGRIDHQVKIRGNRVELGEIESALRRIPGVKDVIVVANNDQLVAYMIVDTLLASFTDWRATLAASLPGFMIPSYFVPLDDFPRTPNGKVDRSALPHPKDALQSESFTAPITETEHRLAQIWREVLGVDRVSIKDNFFNIGGNSILSIRVFARIAEQLKVNLPLSVLFTDSTIETLASRVDEQKGSNEDWPVLVTVQPHGSSLPFFAIHGIEGGVLGYRDLALALGNDQPFLGLQAVGQDGRQAYDESVEAMAARYIEVMRACQPKGPYRIGGYCFGGMVAYEMARQLEKLGEHVSVLAMFESSMPESGEFHVSLSRRLWATWSSLPAWIRDYSRMTPRQLLNRLHSTTNKVWSRLRPNPDVERRMRVEETLDRIDIDNLPRQHIELTDALIDASIQYVPNGYSGKITLFRARNRGVNEIVFGSLDPTMGWERLAKGGVDVRLVDGFHRNMHLAPYASSLASELRKCLDEDSKGRDSSGV